MAINDFNEEKVIKANGFGKFIFFLSFLLIIPIFIYIAMRNNLIRLETKVKEADSGIDVQLAKRRDMLTKLIEAVKKALKFEKETLEAVTQLRNTNLNNLNPKEKSVINSKMDDIQKAINVQLEAYPDLTATKNISDLQDAIQEVENDISASRRIYNSNVNYYNTKIQQYPTTVAAQSLNSVTKLFFEATDRQKEDVVINLD
ncbi:LemA family protein [Spiroplasma endosymbiont of Anurida maritima]|uniref:LemA family protein n=1 Tax=Spiroplasma endosymbiont of Anurida maritima TaxID=2967972 RepID=UPI0036D379A0